MMLIGVVLATGVALGGQSISDRPEAKRKGSSDASHKAPVPEWDRGPLSQAEMRRYHPVLIKVFKTLRAERHGPVLAELDRLRYLPSSERRKRMNSPAFLESYSDGEIVLLYELLDATSRKAP